MDKQGLRSGYTTGSCATAGAKAAALAIVQGKLVDEVEITLPRGRFRFRLNSCSTPLRDGSWSARSSRMLATIRM